MRDRLVSVIMHLSLIPFFLIGVVLNLVLGEGWEDR